MTAIDLTVRFPGVEMSTGTAKTTQLSGLVRGRADADCGSLETQKWSL